MSSQYYFSPNDNHSYQSTANFNRIQQYPTTFSQPQVRASVRVLGNQDQYQLTNSPRLVQISPQQHHFQFDSRQQVGHPSGPAVVYQTPGAAQFTHRNVDLWTERPTIYQQQPPPPPPQDHYVHAQRVSVRSVSTGSPQQSHSISPQRPPTNQIQQISPSTIGQRQYHPIEQQEEYHPVGIRNLMNKFDVHTPRQHNQSRSRSTTTTTRNSTKTSMTYSSLPKTHEPPVNSVEYYQMLQQNGIPFTNLQQAIAPAYIQHIPTGLNSLRDRFKTGSLSEDFNRTIPTHISGGQGNSLSSIRNQYMTQTKENHLPPQSIQNIPRTIVGEDYPPKQQQVAPPPPPPQQEETPAQQPEPEQTEDGVSSF